MFGQPFQATDGRTFWGIYKELIEQECYLFTSRVEDPRILDVGANMGIATLFFKKLYPKARITSFEPDPAIFEVLAQNCSAFELQNVELRNEAAWTGAGELEFLQEGTEAGRLVPGGAGGVKKVRVRTARLRDLLNEPIELLKIDIEGAETEVLLDCEDRLNCVQNLFVEHHSFVGRPQRLDELLGCLTRAGFRLFIKTNRVGNRPFVDTSIDREMDLLLNIYAVRTPSNSCNGH